MDDARRVTDLPTVAQVIRYTGHYAPVVSENESVRHSIHDSGATVCRPGGLRRIGLPCNSMTYPHTVKTIVVFPGYVTSCTTPRSSQRGPKTSTDMRGTRGTTPAHRGHTGGWEARPPNPKSVACRRCDRRRRLERWSTRWAARRRHGRRRRGRGRSLASRRSIHRDHSCRSWRARRSLCGETVETRHRRTHGARDVRLGTQPSQPRTTTRRLVTPRQHVAARVVVDHGMNDVVVVTSEGWDVEVVGTDAGHNTR
jgi:hypothetical protein